MKRRASLLFGLGVLVSLSMSVPTYAATDNTQSIPQTQEAQQNEEGTETSVYKISEKTENGRWQLLKQDGAVVTERNCFYIMGEYCYYVDADGYICTGFVDAAANETTGKVNVYLASGKPADSVAAGTYYASEDGDTPEKGLGNIQKSSWVKQNTAWRYLDENGRAVDTKEKAGWQNIQKTWYALKTDGTVDESVNGWENVGDIWLNSTKGVGTIKTGWQNVADKTWLYLKEDGTADKTKNGMQNINGKVYFLKDGVAQSGKQAVNGKEYMFDAAQGTATQVFGNGWQKVDGNWYWYENGAPAKGWRVINGKWYYMETSTGVMKTGFFRDANGGLYYSDGSGAMVGNPGWNVIGGKWYWMNSNGSIYSGWLNRPSGWYYLTGSGAMAANTWIGSYYVNGSGAWVPGQTTGTTTGGGSKNKIIAIDAGHQRKGNSAKEPIGPGASQKKPKVASGTHGNASGLNEYELTLQVSLKLRDELQARGYQVYMIRETHDVNISNAERAQMAANQGADILVRIHANGSDNTSVAGALTMAPSNSNPYLGKSVISASQTLSRKIVDCFCAATGAKNQGVMQTDTMSGINWSSIPVSIVEMGYMTNRTEDLNMASTSYQTKMVQGIANGIDAYYGA